MKKILLIAVISLFAFTSKAQDTVRILFVGNSYTYVNDLPSLIQSLSLTNNKVVIPTRFLSGGAQFSTHWNNQSLIDTIKKGTFDFMVLQGQSQEVGFPPSQFQSDVYPYAKSLDSLFKAYNTNGQVIFYMTWGYRYGDQVNCQYYAPYCTYFTMSEEICKNYTTMANDFHSLIAPVGKAWQKSILEDSTVVLHQSDNSHPTIYGSYLAACVFYNTIFSDTTSSPFYSTLNQNEAQRMQRIANYITINNTSLPCNLNTPSQLNDIDYDNNVNIWYSKEKQTVNISIEKAYEDYTAMIYSINGKKIKQENMKTKGNSIDSSIDVRQLKQGTYIIKVYSNNTFKTTKFIKL